MSLNSTPRTWASSEVVTAAMMNAEVRDAFTGIQAAWTSYTPAWTGTTTNPVIGNGTIVGAYNRIGKTVIFRVIITMGSTTTYGSGNYLVSLPVTPLTARVRFNVDFLDTSAGSALAGSALLSSGVANLFSPGTTAGGFDRATTSAVPFTFATGDVITITGVYEAS